MIVFGKARWALVAKQFSDAANLAAAALIFQQVIGGRPFSPLAFASGLITWLSLVGLALAAAGREAP